LLIYYNHLFKFALLVETRYIQLANVDPILEKLWILTSK